MSDPETQHSLDESSVEVPTVDAPTGEEMTGDEPNSDLPEVGVPDIHQAEPEDAMDAMDAMDAVEPADQAPGDSTEGSSRLSRHDRLEQEGEIAADYLEELLEITDLDGDLDMDVEGDRATVSIVGAELPALVGKAGEVLEALQELTRLAVFRETGERSRLMLDVSGHRSDRRAVLEAQARDLIARVQESGEKVDLEPMSPFERKIVHDAVAAAGLKSESHGVEPRRHVVILPA